MLIKKVTREELEEALEAVNRRFGNNIVFKKCQPAGGCDMWNVTLTVKNSRGDGARVSPSGRRVSAACWHACGQFMDALPDHARFVTPSVVGYDRYGREIMKQQERQPGDPWEDWNIGSVVSPLQYSEACKCQTWD